jgi:hypothetical protein
MYHRTLIRAELIRPYIPRGHLEVAHCGGAREVCTCVSSSFAVVVAISTQASVTPRPFTAGLDLSVPVVPQAGNFQHDPGRAALAVRHLLGDGVGSPAPLTRLTLAY